MSIAKNYKENKIQDVTLHPSPVNSYIVMDIRLVRLGPVDENSPVYQSGHYDDDQINLYRSEKTTLIYQPQAKHPLILSQPRYLFQDEVSHIL